MEYSLKHQLDNDPCQKVHVTNIGTYVKLRIFEPEIIKDFFQHQNYYKKFDFFIRNLMRFVNGLITAEGNDWKLSRKLFSQAFHFDYIQKLAPLIEKSADNMINEIIANNDLQKFNSISSMQELTGRIVIASFFGESLENERFKGRTIVENLSHILNQLARQTGSLTYLIFGKKFFQLGLTKESRELNNLIVEFDRFLQNKIVSKIQEIQCDVKESGNTQNLSILAQLVTTSQIEQISRQKLFEDFKAFYLAGMDTTGHLLGMTMYYLTQHKDVYSRLQEEIDKNQDQSNQSIQQLPFLNAVIKESLRYYGPANILFDRIATQDHYIGGIPIKKGTIVTPFAISMHRNQKIFENPHSYNPSRWLDKKINEIHSFSYIPFSSGQRNCIGQHLAQMQTKIILYKFIKKFTFTCPADYKLVMAFKFLSEPVDPLCLKLNLRE
ncbi:hypothetical protein ABPG74_001158 [Tetrahymena malaccensis]